MSVPGAEYMRWGLHEKDSGQLSNLWFQGIWLMRKEIEDEMDTASYGIRLGV